MLRSPVSKACSDVGTTLQVADESPGASASQILGYAPTLAPAAQPAPRDPPPPVPGAAPAVDKCAIPLANGQAMLQTGAESAAALQSTLPPSSVNNLSAAAQLLASEAGWQKTVRDNVQQARERCTPMPKPAELTGASGTPSPVPQLLRKAAYDQLPDPAPRTPKKRKAPSSPSACPPAQPETQPALAHDAQLHSPVGTPSPAAPPAAEALPEGPHAALPTSPSPTAHAPSSAASGSAAEHKGDMLDDSLAASGGKDHGDTGLMVGMYGGWQRQVQHMKDAEQARAQARAPQCLWAEQELQKEHGTCSESEQEDLGLDGTRSAAYARFVRRRRLTQCKSCFAPTCAEQGKPVHVGMQGLCTITHSARPVLHAGCAGKPFTRSSKMSSARARMPRSSCSKNLSGT